MSDLSNEVSRGPQLVFDLGERRFSVPVADVRHVAEVPEVLGVPHGPRHYAGLAVLRGQFVPVLDLPAMIEVGCPRSGDGRCLIVVDSGGAGPTVGPLAFLVDAVRGVATGADSTVCNPLDLAGLLAGERPASS